jgi:hypothetical protein
MCYCYTTAVFYCQAIAVFDNPLAEFFTRCISKAPTCIPLKHNLSPTPFVPSCLVSLLAPLVVLLVKFL